VSQYSTGCDQGPEGVEKGGREVDGTRITGKQYWRSQCSPAAPLAFPRHSLPPQACNFLPGFYHSQCRGTGPHKD
jgi:hypothetical protein